ncbi:hypothetical protein [Moraxella catarrhalis]|uniref:hypothetical protein n=1 Tax=Moraxella catarrhalis TaxID=480 RepID=UPI0008034B9C|nr:hypothetical protein [Moraxella catarrhalis]MPX31772.1 hypothetical protein [Moraxella catarrhalis]OBX77551.1 hypothetical protein BAE51_02190 [Moraxella catarrhalis]
MAWVQISEEEAKNHPYWDKFCWVRWLFIIIGMVKAGLLWIALILLFGFKRQYNKHLPFLALVYIPISLYLIMPLTVLFDLEDSMDEDTLIFTSGILFIYLAVFCIYKLIGENSEVFRLQYMKQIKVTQYYNNYYK